MLHILLTIILSILKIIGVILAAVLGILLLALVCGLFVPVRYCVAADGKLGEKPPARVEIKVTWLLHIVNVLFSYHGSVYLRIRLFCFTLWDSSKKKEGKRKKKGNRKKKQKTGRGKNKKEELEKQESLEEERTKEEETPRLETGKAEASEDGEGRGEAGEIEGTPAKEEDRQGAVERIKALFHAVFCFFRKLLEALKNIEYTIKEICGKIKKVMENIRYYIDILQGEAFQSVFKNAKRQLLWIFRKVKPKKCRISLRAGMEDPATTGQIMAAYGMLYPVIGGSVFLQPEFEEKVMEGDIYIKGKITGFIFLVAGLKIALDKNIWRLLKLLKKEGV